jgi:Sec-independent protein translocase protein TatA
MFGLGLGELVIVLLILLILFNRRLPDLGEVRSLLQLSVLSR